MSFFIYGDYVWVTQGRTEHHAMLLEPLTENMEQVQIKWVITGTKAYVPVSMVRTEQQGRGRRRRPTREREGYSEESNNEGKTNTPDKSVKKTKKRRSTNDATSPVLVSSLTSNSEGKRNTADKNVKKKKKSRYTNDASPVLGNSLTSNRSVVREKVIPRKKNRNSDPPSHRPVEVQVHSSQHGSLQEPKKPVLTMQDVGMDGIKSPPSHTELMHKLQDTVVSTAVTEIEQKQLLEPQLKYLKASHKLQAKDDPPLKRKSKEEKKLKQARQHEPKPPKEHSLVQSQQRDKHDTQVPKHQFNIGERNETQGHPQESLHQELRSPQEPQSPYSPQLQQKSAKDATSKTLKGEQGKQPPKKQRVLSSILRKLTQKPSNHVTSPLFRQEKTKESRTSGPSAGAGSHQTAPRKNFACTEEKAESTITPQPPATPDCTKQNADGESMAQTVNPDHDKTELTANEVETPNQER